MMGYFCVIQKWIRGWLTVYTKKGERVGQKVGQNDCYNTWTAHYVKVAETEKWKNFNAEI